MKERFAMEVKETKYFLTERMASSNVIRLYIKNADGSKKRIGCIWPNTEVFFGSELQDCVTSWELFVDLARILDDARDRLEEFRED